MKTFNEIQFEARLEEALKKVRTILDNTRSPEAPSDVAHSYTDKYLFAEFIANTTFAGQLNCLEALGLEKDGLEDLRHWAKNRTVCLRLAGEERCTFEKKVEREEESKVQYVTEVKRAIGSTKVTDKTITKITEYFWKFEVDYEIYAYQGNNMKKKLVLCQRHATTQMKTNSEVTPRPAVSIIPVIDMNITFLLHQLSEDLLVQFKIQREKPTCCTPRRNEDIKEALRYLDSFFQWTVDIQQYFTNRLFPVQMNHGLDLGSICAKEIFSPVVPLFEEGQEPSENPFDATPLFSMVENDVASCASLRVGDMNEFLKEQLKTLHATLEKLQKTFPSDTTPISYAEAKIITVLLHSRDLCQHFSDGVEYIESMLRKQLISAIGKELSPIDFAEYMTYHNRKIFKEEFQPRSFCYAIRRPDHYPEGIISIESKMKDGSISQPISTLVNCQTNVQAPMNFPLNAGASVSFFGDRYLHAWMGHQFSGESGATFNLSARARQFSSFILLIGNIISSDTFDPKYGVIVQNKDDLLIPLLFEQIPTPQAFRDAIESLSPEQQDFAKAFRSMQLESSMFGVCIVQIKPQLEKVLNLPDDSLTKEIQLTQDLQELFISYQIPSDLLRFDPDDFPNATNAQKIDFVKKQVSVMYEMINAAKQEELELATQEATYAAPLDVRIATSVLDISMDAMPEKRKLKKKKLKKSSKKGLKMKKKSGPSLSVAPATVVMDVAHSPVEVVVPSPVEEMEKQGSVEAMESGEILEGSIDYTAIPAKLDANFDRYDEDNALHSTIISVENCWQKEFLKELLAKPSRSTLRVNDLKKEKNKTFDLLDSLTRSGALPVDAAEMHIVLAATHCFDETLINTVIQDNINPIEKIERSSLIVAATIHQSPVSALLSPAHCERIKQLNPALFELNNE